MSRLRPHRTSRVDERTRFMEIARRVVSKPNASFYELTAKYPDEPSAVRYFEERRWPQGVTCPSCSSREVFQGKQPHRRRQVWRCRKCDRRFSVTSGTVMDSTKLPLRKWLLAFHLIGASKKGISSLQLARMLRVDYKTAWHLAHRIRATMTEAEIRRFSGIVETDETYIGGAPRYRGQAKKKIAVQTIIERNRANRKGEARTFALNSDRPDGRAVGAKLRKHTDPPRTVLMTDDSPIYDAVGGHFAEHHAVNHSNKVYSEKALDGHIATTNSAEGYFANLKRQIGGTHHHTSEKHLPRYLAEHDFKYNTRDESDIDRSEAAIENVEGKPLRLFKSKQGDPSLFDREANEPAQSIGYEGEMRAGRRRKRRR